MRMRIGKNRDRILAAAAAGWISFAACCTAQAQAPGRRDSSGPVSLQEEKVQITIPGMEDTCTLLWISDMHIATGEGDPDVTQENRENARERHEMMKDASGLASEDIWKDLSGRIDSYGADYVIFGADMVDYASEENLDKLKAGLDQVQTPWMYLRADHDYGRWYLDMGIRRMRRLHRSIAPQNRLWCARFPDFILAGFDNTTTAISEETLEEFRTLCEEGKPIILCSHVPFDTKQPDLSSLEELSKEAWGGRALCWGDKTEYDTSKGGCMQELMELITAKDSPVRAVLAGHLHVSREGNLTDTCMQHVFGAAFEDHIGIVTISG